MTSNIQKDRIAALADEILFHKRFYYSGSPKISDAAYDQLEDELRSIAPHHPALASVGSDLSSDNAKVTHDPPMLSLAKTYDFDELIAWTKGRELVATLKIDGVALSLIYKSGQLHLAKTRGNGTIGEDVTAKVRWAQNSPAFIDVKDHPEIEIRGELCCSESQFARLFAEMESLNLETPSNPRNIVAGILGRKQYFELARYFQFFAFDVLFPAKVTGDAERRDIVQEQKVFHTESEKFQWLDARGFKVVAMERLKTPEEIAAYLDQSKASISNVEIGIDGVVFSYNDLSLHESLGSTSHHPRYKMSFKWQGQTAEATIKSFKWMTSRFGYVTPVAVIKPVTLSGAQITNVTLHNAAFVKLFNLKAGDRIEIIRSGEVIPKFLKVIEAKQGAYEFPEACPSCNSSLIYDEVRLLCLNAEGCPAQQLRGILNWIASAEIDDLSAKRLEEMVKLGLVRHMSDLYTLSIEDLMKLPLTKEKMAKKLFGNIQKSKTLSLPRFLTGLGISGMGKNSWESLLEYFPTMDALLEVSPEQISIIPGFAEKTSQQIVTGLREKENDIQKLYNVGVQPASFVKKLTSASAPLRGQSFVITGALSRPREEIQQAIEAAGGKVVGSVSAKVTALITDDPNSNSSKAKKARDLGIACWSEDELLTKLQV